ncbi:MAG: PP2C family protein-serine/threonine phosphatase, partial [bacterium]|nr:PP2C family protein-serine/threonine phosphatase [bacterium]
AAWIFPVLMWILVGLVIIVRFIKKIRRDELEFRRSFLLCIPASIISLSFVGFSVSSGGGRLGMLFAAILALLLTALSVLLIVPVADSQCRSVWPEKLKVMDQLFQGRLFIRETGISIMNAFFIGGIILLVLGAALRLSPYLGNFVYLNISWESVNMYRNVSSAFILITNMLILSLILLFAVFGSWAGFLKEKLRNKTSTILVLAISLAPLGLTPALFTPYYSGLLLLLPISVIWAVSVHKYNIITLFFAICGVKALLSMMLIMFLPGALSSFSAIFFITFAAVIFLGGALLVFSRRSADDYDIYIPEYVSRIAERERMQRELEIARSVQMRFLPRSVPQFSNLEIVSLCQPAMEVGGDYYDFIQVDDRHITVLIGDVSGKGVSAAFYMTMVKGIIKTLAKKEERPAALLTDANEIFCENSAGNVFITIIYGIFDLKEKKLTIASAGHNPLIIWKSKQKKIELVNPRGIALGLAKETRCHALIEEKNVLFDDGDIFVFYTDGVSEAMNLKGDVFGEERLCKIIEESAASSPAAIQQNIIDAVADFSGKAPQHDDFTMVVVKAGDHSPRQA